MFQLKCHQYWPIDEGHTVVYGAIRVHMRSLTHCQAWIERIMHVQHAEVREGTYFTRQKMIVIKHFRVVSCPNGVQLQTFMFSLQVLFLANQTLTHC